MLHFLSRLQGREGKVVEVYRRKWVIHVERITKDKKNGKQAVPMLYVRCISPAVNAEPCLCWMCSQQCWQQSAPSA